MAGSDFLPEVPKQLFLRMRGENMPKTHLRCCQIATILVHFYKKSWSLNTMVRAVFTPKAELTLFLRMCSENRPQTRLCCQIAKILAPLWAIAVAEHDGI